MMPLDPILPKLAVSVLPHTNGKANERSNAHLRDLKVIYRDSEFMTVAFSADGDNAYEEFLRPLCDDSLGCRSKEVVSGIYRGNIKDGLSFRYRFMAFLKMSAKSADQAPSAFALLFTSNYC
jgi:hypothetical protein